MLENIQLSIEKFGPQEITFESRSFLRFRDKGPGADNINLMIKIFPEFVELSMCFPFPKFHWILICDG